MVKYVAYTQCWPTRCISAHVLLMCYRSDRVCVCMHVCVVSMMLVSFSLQRGGSGKRYRIGMIIPLLFSPHTNCMLRPQPHCRAQTHTHTFSPSLSLSLFPTHSLIQTHTRPHTTTHTTTHTHTHTHTHTRAHTHTQTHTHSGLCSAPPFIPSGYSGVPKRRRIAAPRGGGGGGGSARGGSRRGRGTAKHPSRIPPGREAGRFAGGGGAPPGLPPAAVAAGGGSGGGSGVDVFSYSRPSRGRAPGACFGLCVCVCVCVCVRAFVHFWALLASLFLLACATVDPLTSFRSGCVACCQALSG